MLLLGAGGVGMLASLNASAQQGNISVRVTDQQTGFAVANATVTVLGPAGRTETFPAAKQGRLALTGRAGELTFLISAVGYAPLTTHFRAGEVAQLNAEVQLDRVPGAGPARSLPRAPAAALAPDQTCLQGYVSDRATGAPLAGVRVRAGAATATTDAAGHYEMLAAGAAPAPPELVKLTTDITFAKDGYVEHQLPKFRVIGDEYTFRISLAPAADGAAGRAMPPEMEVSPQGFFDKTGAEPDQPNGPSLPAGRAVLGPPLQATAGVVVPASIRVGTACSCNDCASVTVLSLEAYVRSGLDNEWISSWTANSLRAGAIVYRTYGAYHVRNPIRTNYDTSNTTCRQVWDATEVASTRDAANFTQGVVLQKNGAIAFAEYSSENNNAGCGDGLAGTGTTTAPCIADPLCRGRAKFGHGRGMCQFGSSFWSAQGQTHLWIVDHYFTPAGLSLNTAAPAADTQAPTTAIAGPASATGNFTATFADADNVGVTGRYYQPLEWRTTEWRANRGNGFYNDNFGTGALHPDYTPGLADWQGTWAATAAGTLRQSNVTATNTALSTFLSQTSGNTYLYNFSAKVNNTSGARRFGLHLMASDVTLRERGNSYLVWFAVDQQTVSIIETTGNVLTPRASAPLVLTGGTWSDYKVLYNTTTGALDVFQNNRLVVSWTDATPLTAGANLSLRTSEADVEFDDLKVFKGRGASVVISVGAGNANDVRTSASPGAKIKSLVNDAAHNWSALANLDVDTAIPTALGAVPDGSARVYPNPVGRQPLTLEYALETAARAGRSLRRAGRASRHPGPPGRGRRVPAGIAAGPQGLVHGAAHRGRAHPGHSGGAGVSGGPWAQHFLGPGRRSWRPVAGRPG